MGGIGLDRWSSRMEQHKRLGHRIILYPGDRKDAAEEALFLKERRVAYWERHHRMISPGDMDPWDRGTEI